MIKRKKSQKSKKSVVLTVLVLPFHCDFFFVADVLRTQDDPNKFIFFEVYESVDAINSHKTQPHYLQYAEFKESGGMVSSVSSRADGLYMTK